MSDASRYDVEVDPDASNNPHSHAIQLVGNGQQVLEIGSAAGHVTHHLIQRGNDVVGIELDADAAAVARERGFDVHVADLDHTPASSLVNGPFDVVLAGDVLEHFRNPEPVLADLVSLLGPDGRLVISVPNLAHADVRLMLLDGRVEYADCGLLDRTHLRWFNRAGIRDLLASVGFTATELLPVIVPMGATDVPIELDAYADTILDFVRTDPDHDVFQFVVAAERGTGDGALEASEVQRPEPTHSAALHQQIHALRDENHHLRNAVDAWERSRVARVSSTLRRLTGRGR